MTADHKPAQAGRDGTRHGQASKPSPSAGRTPDYAAARRRFARHVVASKRARRQRLALAAVGVLSVLTLLISGIGWAVTTDVSAGLDRLDAGTSGTPASGPVNILVVGIDSRGGLTQRQKLRLHVGNATGANTDTMMVVHIPADHDSVQVVSLPRDSWVNIPGHGMNKINAAYGLGGPSLMVRTVHQATGLAVNDYVEVNFRGFVQVIDDLGGVNVCLPFPVDDSNSGLQLSAGPHHVDGITALEFARDRDSFATSDLARIADQQQLLSSLLAEATATGVVANPVRLQQLLSAVTSAVEVDRGFNLVELADELRGVRPADVSFTTVPIASANYQTPTGESAVLWNGPAAAALFRWLKNDAGPVHLDSQPDGSRRAAPATSARGQAAPGGQRTAAQDACR